MDGQRFETLARAVARNGSRRGLLRGLLGAAGLLALGDRAPGVAAQDGYLGPGEACYDDSQCGNTRYSAMICADNGLDYDGPLNCCTGEGGYCFSDEGCCGFASCIDGSCTSTSSYTSPGDPCRSNDDCFAGGLVCDYVGQTDDLRCCSYEGGSCGWDGQCCGWLTCGAGGYCGSDGPVPDIGLPLGAQCSYAAQCSGGGYGVDCADNGGYVPACCLTSGQSCSADLDCCMPNNCLGGFCGSGAQDPSAFVTCSGVGCTCIGGAPGACDDGMMCCVQGDPGALGFCLPVDACYVSMAACTDVGCSCAVHDPYACGFYLICCGPGEAGAIGTCQTIDNC